MNKYTVICDYFATGEGRAMSIWMGFADSKKDALKQFKRAIENGDWYAQGADVIEGFDFDNHVAKLLLSPGAASQMQDENCYRNLSAKLHFNYS